MEGQLTNQALPVFRISIKVLSVADHAASQVRNWQRFFLIVSLCTLRDGLDVGSHGLVNVINTCKGIQSVFMVVHGHSEMHTFMAHTHLRLHGLEIIRLTRLGLTTHTLSRPLLKPTDPLIHMHCGLSWLSQVE